MFSSLCPVLPLSITIVIRYISHAAICIMAASNYTDGEYCFIIYPAFAYIFILSSMARLKIKEKNGKANKECFKVTMRYAL